MHRRRQVPLGPRFLPTRPGQNVTASRARSGVDYRLASRLMEANVRNSFARVGLVVKPELRQLITNVENETFRDILFKATEFETDQFQQVHPQTLATFRNEAGKFYAHLMEQQESNIGMQPTRHVNLANQVVPQFFCIADLFAAIAHVVGAVQVPAAKAVQLLNGYPQDELDKIAMVLEDWIHETMDPTIAVFSMPNDLMAQDLLEKQIPQEPEKQASWKAVIEDLNLQEVPGVVCEGFCSQFAFILPQMMSRDGVFSYIDPDVEVVRTQIFKRLLTWQGTHRDTFTLTFQNDIKREIGLL